MTRQIPDDEWPARLKEFTQRNAGRLTIIEEDGLDLGVQLEEQGIQLRGVAYDPHDRSVAIMLGPLEGTDQHITHVVHDVVSIDVLKRTENQDEVMRVAHGDGQTILRFYKA
jgi:Family of unknown function (DUF5335)